MDSSKGSKDVESYLVGVDDDVDPKTLHIHAVDDDILKAIVLLLPADELLAFSLTCHRFNDTRKAQGFHLRTSLAWTLGSPSVSAWTESIGRPSPYPHWAELHNLPRDCHNGLIVKVTGELASKNRQTVRLHSSLSDPEMQSCVPGLRVNILEGPLDSLIDEMNKEVLVGPSYVRVLQPPEVARVKVLFFSKEGLSPGQSRGVSGLEALFIQAAEQWNLEEHQSGQVLCSKPVLGIVGGNERLLDGLIAPRMSGVEVVVRKEPKYSGSTAVPIGMHDPNTTLDLLGGRPFEILEVLNNEYCDHPSMRDTLLGKAKIFHARVRWIPRLPRSDFQD